MAKFVAKSEGCSIVVFAIDADTCDERIRDAKTASIEDGFAAFDNGVTGVPCVPMGTSESWLLADRAAWETIGLHPEDAFPERSPEGLWGTPNDPRRNHPKRVFEQVCCEVDVAPDQSVRADLAANVNVQRVAQQCPLSFRPFAERLSAALTSDLSVGSTSGASA